MKKIWIILIIVLVIIISLMVILKRRKIELTKDNIKYIHFSYSTGNMMYSNVQYYVDYKDYKYIATIKPDGLSEEEAKKIEIDENTIEKLINVLNKYKVYNWNNFHKNDKRILDGNSFSFYLSTKDNKTIEASGYMKWPKNYSNVKSELDSIFSSLYNVEKINIEDLDYLHFSYSKGYAMNSNIIYDINKTDNKYIASIKPYEITNEETKKIEINKETLKQIENILNKYNVVLWNGFHENDKNVLDGDSFSFSLKTNDTKISASGYMMWPSNYSNVRDELDIIFNKLYEEIN